ncbi:COX assembly mitochondrial protein homolog [Mya arenaria]|uniref:COX assembly mitochondrial protein homolog n=1 Tax=Mya arenaria TaxID=6604 RepID=UPI0022E84724|nr:COX assembly mitochondrial protein homolog [Mya arenaria]
MADKGDKNEEGFTVLSPKLTAGPLGLGDPDDTYLRKVEVEIVYKKMRETSALRCEEESRDFHECMKANPNASFSWRCRKAMQGLKRCQNEWFKKDGFFEEMRDEYIKQRAEFRKTGVCRMAKETEKRFDQEFEEWERTHKTS